MTEKTIEELKDLADGLGIQYHPSIGAEKLAAKIEEAASGPAEPEEPVQPVKKERTREELKAEATKLIRVRVTCMNPAKRDWEGEVFCAGNRVTGTLKKYVPFGVEWHVPQIILNMIQNREAQIFTTVKQRTGAGVINKREGKLIKEFAVEILPQLSEQELKDLAQRQAMARGTSAA